MRKLIIGIGNPILSDDSIGIRIAEKFDDIPMDTDIKIASAGGLDVVDMMQGYDKVIVVDGVMVNDAKPGQIIRMDIESLKNTINLNTTYHGMNLATAIEFYKTSAPEQLPKEIVIYGVQVKNITEFSEKCSPEVEQAIPTVLGINKKGGC